MSKIFHQQSNLFNSVYSNYLRVHGRPDSNPLVNCSLYVDQSLILLLSAGRPSTSSKEEDQQDFHQ